MLALATGAAATVPAELFAEIASLVAEHHLSAPSREAVLEMLRRDGSLAALDPYTAYLPPARFRQLNQPTPTPAIGASLLREQGEIWLIPRQSGALARSGVDSAARLRRIGAWVVAGHSLAQVRHRLASSKVVELELQPPGNQATVRVRVAARTRALPPVEHDLTRRLIAIHRFEPRTTVAAVRNALLEIAGGANARRLTLDLRFATGGDLFEAMDVAALFLTDDDVLAVTVDSAQREQVYRGLREAALWREPVNLLTGPYTASAAEVLVRALDFHGMAHTMGQTTYGKCSAQILKPLANGGAVKITNLLVSGPDRRPCDGKGIEPEQPLSGYDYVLPRALRLLRLAPMPQATSERVY